jgi:hypothetical protein
MGNFVDPCDRGVRCETIRPPLRAGSVERCGAIIFLIELLRQEGVSANFDAVDLVLAASRPVTRTTGVKRAAGAA